MDVLLGKFVTIEKFLIKVFDIVQALILLSGSVCWS